MTVIDSVVLLLAKGIARVTGWSPIGCRVSLRLTEGDASVVNKVVFGTVSSLADRPAPDVATLIELEDPIVLPESHGSDTKRVIATPRYSGHGPFRLVLGSSVVNLYDAGGTTSLSQFDETRANQFGIAIIRLATKKQ